MIPGVSDGSRLEASGACSTCVTGAVPGQSMDTADETRERPLGSYSALGQRAGMNMSTLQLCVHRALKTT